MTSDTDVVRAVLSRFGVDESKPPTDEQVIDLFTSLARSAAEGGMICDAGALVRVFSNLVSINIIVRFGMYSSIFRTRI